MTIHLGDMIARIGADTTGLRSGMAQGAAAVRSQSAVMRAQLQQTKQSLLSFNKVFLAVTGGWVAKNVVGSFTEVAASFEKMQVKLDALTSGRGAETLEQINDWALKMPVNTREAVNAFVQMQAMGLNPTIDKMQILTDVASIFGDDVLGRVSLALGQMSTLGRVSAQDLNQLAQAGINARKYLKQAFGMTVEEFQQSGRAVSDAVEAIWTGMEKEFGGSALKMMDSWNGLVIQLKSGIVEFQRTVMKAGIFDEMKKGLKDANTALYDYLENNRELIKLKTNEYLQKTTEALKSVYDKMVFVKSIYDALPEEVIGVAGVGIIGRILFGATPAGRLATGLLMANEALGSFNLNLGSLKDKYDDLNEATKNIWDVITGQKDWNTGLPRALEKANEEADKLRRIKEPTGLLKAFGDVDKLKAFREQLQGIGDAAKYMSDVMSNEALEAIEAQKRAEEAYADMLYKRQLKFKDTWQIIGEIEKSGIESDTMAALKAQEAYDEMIRKRSENYKDPWQLQAEDRVDVNERALEILRKQEKEHSQFLTQISERTAWNMQETFSNFFFDAFKGKLNDLGDYVNAFLDAMLQSIADVMGQMTTQAIFGRIPGSMGGGGGLLDSAIQSIGGWMGGIFGGSAPPATSAGIPSGSNITWSPRQAGGAVVPGESYLVGEKGPEIFTSDRSGSIIQPGQQIHKTEIFINTPPNTTSKVKRMPTENGIEKMIIQIVANDMLSGGDIAKAGQVIWPVNRTGR